MDFRLQAFRNVIRSEFEPLEFFPNKTHKAYEVVRSKFEEGDLTPPVNLEDCLNRIEKDVIGKNKSINKVLTKKELRYLPYLSYQGNPEFIKNDQFFSYIRNEFLTEVSSSVLSGWIQNYLKNKSKDSENHRYIGELIKNCIIDYNGKSKRCVHWKEHVNLMFSDESHIAMHLLSQSKSIRDFLIDLKLTTELNIGDWSNEIIKNMINQCSNSFPRHLSQCLEELKFKDRDGKEYYRQNDLFRYAATVLLRTAGISAQEEQKEKIKRPLLNKMKDPRVLTNRVNWTGVDQGSVDIMKQWLSARDIEFFFEIVSETEARLNLDTHWEYRKAFWMSYLPFIEDTWVVMGSRAKEITKFLINRNNMEHIKFGSLSGAESIQSVFFLRIKGVDIVEYSHNGASRIWSIDRSPLDFRENTINVNKFRRNAPPELEKFSHYSSELYKWQRDMSYWLRRHLGIEASQSYKI